jgi:hypothetical protein
MLIFVPCISFATLDPTVAEFEEEYFEDFEENQGQATQGKPPLLVAYLDPSFIYASFSIYVYSKMHCSFHNCYYLSIAIHWRLGSTSHLISSLKMTPLNTYLLHYLVVA